MRRFRKDHEGIRPDENVLALWRFDEPSTTSNILDSAYSATFTATRMGGSNYIQGDGVFDAQANHAKRLRDNTWYQSLAAASAHTFLGTTATAGLAVNLWWLDEAATATA